MQHAKNIVQQRDIRWRHKFRAEIVSAATVCVAKKKRAMFSNHILSVISIDGDVFCLLKHDLLNHSCTYPIPRTYAFTIYARVITYAQLRSTCSSTCIQYVT
jgi:predicted nucleic acid-binding protein